MDKLFFDLRATHNPHRWFLPVDPSICVGPPGSAFMFGGVGLASAVAAMERTCERPLIWATAQYLNYARPGSVVDIDVWTPVEGKHTTQARVISHVDDREIITVNAALGRRESPYSAQWTNLPDVAPPEDCDVAEHWRGSGEGLHTRLEVRIAQGRYGKDRQGNPAADGRTVLWARPRGDYVIDATMLAIMADLVPSGIGNALGKNAGGNSLDNTLRIRNVTPTEWVLCDIRILGVHGGFAHGTMFLYSRDGELMATASQSVIVRVREQAEDR
ncbi:acyl-CoA thioesterase II [uncultured Phenylobacterium sp.]|uniref:acyl-CoA thioesterase n=1 Tax=uncultured Phenylobacterium sp. TaxID=349273 RepID=UPI0025F278E9|nr:acyl-CoA thioesterase domain-containing protein [uncultured Phenylobacterium sp.]